MNKFKFLFIAVFALIVAVVATLLALKGSFKGEIVISSSVYGESYADPEGVSAFWSDVSYEYAIEGSDAWTDKKPVKAGKYSVRAVSDKTVGKGYGKNASFEIAPREVEFSILSDSVEYGGVPNEVSLELLAGDRLDRTALSFLYDDYVSERTAVDLDENSVKITNGTDDRSACYTVKHEKKELEITKRSISVSLDRMDFVYSGSGISYSKIPSENTKTRLANGDEIRIGSVTILKNGAPVESAVRAGSYEATVGEYAIYKVIDGKEYDVTAQYDKRSFSVPFEIAKKKIAVKTASAEQIYDGTPLSKADGSEAAGLVAGDTLFVNASTHIVHAQTIQNKLVDYLILSADGTDVGGDYDIEWHYGTLTVKPRSITITSPDGSWIYNGEVHRKAEVSCTDEIFEARVVSASSGTGVLTVGSYKNIVDYVIENKSTHERADASDFTVTQNWGTLAITRREIGITVRSVEKLYDGTPLFATPERGEVSVTDGSLAEGDGLVADRSGKLFSLTNVKRENGIVVGVLNESEYRIECGGSDRTENYDIQYTRGTLTVNPRHITLLTDSNNFVYDGEPHSDGGCTIFENGVRTDLIGGNTLTLVGNAPAFTNVSETKNALNNNVCEYDAGQNYVIDSVAYGTVTVLPRTLTIVTNSASFVYDGNAHSDGGFSDYYNGGKGLIGEDKLTLLTFSEVTVVGDTAIGNNVCTYSVPNENYELKNYTYGTLTVQPRPITVTSPSETWVYDGEEHSKAEITCEDTVFKAEVFGAPLTTVKNKTSAPIRNCVNYQILNAANAVEDRANFAVTENWGELAVTARGLTITSPSESWIYDAIVHSLAIVSCTDEYFSVVPAGETVKTSIKDFGTATNEVFYSIIKKSTNEAETDLDNFAITQEWGTLTVTAREIRVVTDSDEKIYDGIPLEKNEYVKTYHTNADGEQAGLLGGDVLTLKDRYSIVNVKDSGENKCTFSEPNANYKIIGYDCGTLTITPKAVTVQVAHIVEIYGEELKYPVFKGNFGITEDGGFIGEDTLTITAGFDLSAYGFKTGDRIPVRWQNGEIDFYYNVIRPETVEFFGSDENNYTITYLNGYLKIMRRAVHVSLLEGVKTYYGEDIYTEDGKSAVYPSDRGNVQGVYFNNGGVTVYDKAGLLEGDNIKIINVKYKDAPLLNPDGENGSGTTDEYVIPKNAAHYYTAIDEVWVYLSDGTIEKTTADTDAVRANYLIESQTCGELEILPRPIRVTLNSIETKMFDGEVRVYPSGGERVALDGARADYPELLHKSDAFGYGERLNVKVVFGSEPILRGEYIYSFDRENSTAEDYDGAGGYTASSRRLKNYDVACDDGRLEITKRPVTVKMKDYTFAYGDTLGYSGLPHEVVSELDFVWGGWIYAGRIDWGCGERPAVGTYTITMTPSGVNCSERPEYGNIIDCYEITVLPGTLTIVPKDVTVTTWKRSSSYGKRGPEDWVLKFNNTDLAYDETLDMEYQYFQNGVAIEMPKDAGVYDVQLVPVLSVGEEGLKNYNFIYIGGENPPVKLENGFFAGMLTITPLSITVSVSQKDALVYGDSILDAVEITVESYWSESGYSWALPYGEKLTVSYTFQKNGVTVTPKYADTYEIVIGNQLLIDGSAEGMKNYDVTEHGELKNGTLTITPREITVRLDSLTIDYGDPLRYESGNDGTNYSFVSGELVYDDELFVTTEHLAAGTGNDRPIVGTYAIRSKEKIVLNGGADTVDGYKIAESYSITVEEGVLTVNKRPITLVLNQDFKESMYYDGKTHNYVSGGEKIGGKGMAEEEDLKVAVGYTSVSGHSIVKQVAKADRYVCWFDPENSRITYGEKEIPLSNYEIVVENIEREIMPRTVKVTLLDLGTKVYGDPVVYPVANGNYKAIEAVAPVPGGLVEGESLRVAVCFLRKADGVKYANGSGLFFGEYEVAPSDRHIVTGGTYADAKNYSFEFDDNSVFTVEKRALTLTLSSVSADYGERPVYYEGEGNYASVTNFAGGETLTVQSVAFTMPEQAQVGDYMNAVALNPDSPQSVKITRGGSDVTDNYTITEVKAKLTVVKRKVTVTTATNSFVYDGQKHSDGSYTIVYQKNGGAGLAYDDLSVIHEDYARSLPAVEEYSPSATTNKFAIAMKRGAEDVTRNYEITYVYGNLSIVRRIIYVVTKSAEKVYDGDPLVSPAEIESCYHYKDNDPAKEKLDGLVAGHKFRFGTVSIVDAGYVLNDTVEDILNGAGDTKLFNYQIAETELGKLTVHRRNIYVDASSDTKVYDGTPLLSPDDNYTVTFYPNNDATQTPLRGAENVLVKGHSFAVAPPSLTDAGTIDNNKFTGVTGGVKDVSDNYLIISQSGKLTVEQREVTVTVGDITMTYRNGAPTERPSIAYEREGETEKRGILLADEKYFSFTPLYVAKGMNQEATRFNAGEYDIMISIGDGTGKNNYAFYVDVGLLTVEKAELFVKPLDRWELYVSADQKIVINAGELEFGDTALAAGDSIVSCELTRTELRASENKVSASVKIRKGSLVVCDVYTGESVAGNYEITLSAGYIGFIQRTLYFEQIIPDGIDRDPITGKGTLPYTGKKVDFSGGSGALFRVLSADEVDTQSKRAGWSGADTVLDMSTYGLLASDGVVLKNAYVGSQVCVYGQWVNLNVVNGETGEAVSRLYNVVCVMRAGTDSSIEVLPVQAKISFSASLTQSVLDGAEVGLTLLDPSCIRSAEGLWEDHLAEAALYKTEDGKVSVYVFIYAPRYKDGVISSRNDKSLIYAVTASFDSGISPSVELVGTAIYPKG